MHKVFLLTEDGEQLPVDESLVLHSGLLYRLYRSDDLGDDSEGVCIPLTSVSSPILLLAMELSQLLHSIHQCACPKQKNDQENMSIDMIVQQRTCSSWIADCRERPESHSHPLISEFFQSIDQKTLVDLINLSNFFEFAEGIELGCKHVALMIRGKSPRDIRRLFHIECDFTPQEIEQMKAKNEWTALLE